MAIIGLKYPVYGKFQEGEAPSWANGKVIGKAISSNITLDGTDANVLYADDAAAESDSAFQGGNIELGVDDLEDEDYADLLGHKYTAAAENEPAVVVANSADIAPYVGVGFYKTRVRKSVRTYRATVIHKVQFSEPSDAANTRGERTEWQTPTITGAIMADVNGDWKTQATFTDEAAAKAWINTKLGVTEG